MSTSPPRNKPGQTLRPSFRGTTGQRPLALLPHARLLDNPVDQLRREHLRQHPDPDPVRQPVPGYHLLPSPGHAGELTLMQS